MFSAIAIPFLYILPLSFLTENDKRPLFLRTRFVSLKNDNKKISSTLKIPLYNSEKNMPNTTILNGSTRISTKFQIAWYEKRVIAYISSRWSTKKDGRKDIKNGWYFISNYTCW